MLHGNELHRDKLHGEELHEELIKRATQVSRAMSAVFAGECLRLNQSSDSKSEQVSQFISSP